MRLIFCESYLLTYEGLLFLDGIDGALEVESPPVFLYDGITPGELMGAELLDQQACSSVIADEAFTLLMGDMVAPRKEYIEKHAKYVQNLDI